MISYVSIFAILLFSFLLQTSQFTTPLTLNPCPKVGGGLGVFDVLGLGFGVSVGGRSCKKGNGSLLGVVVAKWRNVSGEVVNGGRGAQWGGGLMGPIGGVRGGGGA